MSRSNARLLFVVLSTALIVAVGVAPGIGQPAPAQPAPSAPQPQAPASYSGGCVTNRIKFRTEYAVQDITTTGTWVTVPSTAVDFTIGGTGYSCLKIEWSAAVAHTGGIYFVAELDGGWWGLPTYVYHAPEGDYHTFAFNWAFKDVWPGPHTLRIKVWNSSGTLTVGPRSVFVHYFQ